MKLILILAILHLSFSIYSADRVVYSTFFNGQEVSKSERTVLLYADSTLKIYTEYGQQQHKDVPLSEATYIDLRAGNIFRRMINKDNQIYSVRTSLSELQSLTFTDEIDEIEVGGKRYVCKKANVVVFSNSIDIWYTDELRIKGSPSPRNGLPGGLVLKWVRNGNTELRATDIQLSKRESKTSLLPADMGIFTDDAGFQARSTENYITTIRVFDDEQISWGRDVTVPADDSQVFHFVNGTVIARKVRLPDLTAYHSIFAELTQYSNGDAYDRTGSVFVIPVDKDKSFLDGLSNGISSLPVYKTSSAEYQGVVRTSEFDPLIELMRFFTPFGIGHFNERRKVEGIEWEDKAFYKQDISQFRMLLRNEVWIGMFIGNYDRGGHKVTLDLKYHSNIKFPSTATSDNYQKGPMIMPLFNTLNVMEMGGQNYGTMFGKDSLTVDFDLPEGLKSLQLRYISTGHGGWGNGDEFVPKQNTIIVDDEVVYNFTPYRSDCATYRNLNPASGNSWNGLTSSDYSRSGWCPGTITNPVFVDLSHLKPGRHTLKVAIPLGASEGNSFSSWNVSGVLFGYY